MNSQIGRAFIPCEITMKSYVHMKTCENSFPLKSYASYEFMMILPAGLGMNTMIYSSHAAAPEVVIMISSEVE